MAELIGNLLVAQSGGPTAVINASLAGVIQEAGHHEDIEEIYGGANGILGALAAALLLGVLDVAGKYYVPSIGAFIIYAVMVVTLILRPRGLFARGDGR